MTDRVNLFQRLLRAVLRLRPTSSVSTSVNKSQSDTVNVGGALALNNTRGSPMTFGAGTGGTPIPLALNGVGDAPVAGALSSVTGDNTYGGAVSVGAQLSLLQQFDRDCGRRGALCLEDIESQFKSWIARGRRRPDRQRQPRFFELLPHQLNHGQIPGRFRVGRRLAIPSPS
jgi:hypothetical protein